MLYPRTLLAISFLLVVGTVGAHKAIPAAQPPITLVSQESEIQARSDDAVKIISGKVVGLTDGDTIIVLQDKTPYKIRLEGIDAPESSQAYGAQSRKALGGKVFQKEVQVKWKEKDKYKRILGDVYLGGRWINKELVEEGWAWHYKQYSKSKELAQAEEKARGSKGWAMAR